MKKLERRAIMCLMLTAVLFIGLVVFAWRYVAEGEDWAGFYGNTQIFTNGVINRGSVYDRNNEMLIRCSVSGLEYPDDAQIRAATVHAVGDPGGNIADGAINKFSSQLIGYDLLNGTYDTSTEGKRIQLTIDSEACRTAYNELKQYDAGMIGIFNYETGEIMCMVSTPSFDPDGDAPDGDSPVYFNNFYQGLLTPGSTFKLVTSAAAIDTIPGYLEDFSFSCDGTNEYHNEDFTCVAVHGTQGFESALANSCNGAFGTITRELGAATMGEYVDKLGLTQSVNVNGIKTAEGTFVFPDDNEISLSWAGIGQGQDQVNPCSMMVYVGAIANGGEAVQPYIIKESNFIERLSNGKSLGEYLSKDTADTLKEYMKNNVESAYGTYNYEGLDMYAKSGTAEVGDRDDAWFVGFIGDEGFPYAFVCWVQGGGRGSIVAGGIVRDTIYTLMDNE